ncbi:MAG: sialate O-acetylesterase [Paludibacter sp.]|nr:sialate O-acetylesterase [Paludibacter sp.]
MKQKYCIILLLVLCPFLLFAKVKLPGYWGSGMVLQQLSAITIEGKTVQNTLVTITCSWSKKTVIAKSDNNGNWECVINTPRGSSMPCKITFFDGDSLALTNVLIGEVWLCSGQSNMFMPMAGMSKEEVVENSQKFIDGADVELPLRLFTVPRKASSQPVDEIGGGVWSLNTSQNVAKFSAVAYFFGLHLQKQLNVPVGLIQSAWSGSGITSWMSKESILKFPEIKLTTIPDSENKRPNKTPALLYNGMIYPLRYICFKGVIWYQGEANRNVPATYEGYFNEMLKQWRAHFNQPDLPFYFVQLAPFEEGDEMSEKLPVFWEVQMSILKNSLHVGMAFTNDLGNQKYIHAPRKQEVGERLAYCALNMTYGKTHIACYGPVFSSLKRVGNKVIVDFDYACRGLESNVKEVIGFEMADKNGVVKKAHAKIIKGTSKVEVWCEDIPNPVQLRYCFRNYLIGSLFNSEGLPAASFRTAVY